MLTKSRGGVVSRARPTAAMPTPIRPSLGKSEQPSPGKQTETWLPRLGAFAETWPLRICNQTELSAGRSSRWLPAPRVGARLGPEPRLLTPGRSPWRGRRAPKPTRTCAGTGGRERAARSTDIERPPSHAGWARTREPLSREPLEPCSEFRSSQGERLPTTRERSPGEQPRAPSVCRGAPGFTR